MWRKIGIGVGGVLAALALSLVVGVLTSTSRQVDGGKPLAVEVDGDRVARELVAAVRFPTVSQSGGQVNGEATMALQAWLRETYPTVFAQAKVEQVRVHTLLLTLEGTEADLDPAMWMAHQDVVPPEGEWTHPPFEGVVADGFVWGRGTLDDKHNLVTQLHALERLLESGWRPRRTLYLCFGADEEVGGKGAEEVADRLAERDVWLHYVLDEGGGVYAGVFPGLGAGGFIGIAEKGYVSMDLVVKGKGGHSSTPPPSTAAGQLARAVTRVEENPIPSVIAGPTAEMLDTLAPELTFPMRAVFSNRWLFDPVIRGVMDGKPASAATVRTTQAVTVLRAGSKDNVLPQEARATVNFRLLPGQTVASVKEHLVRVIDDPEVEVVVHTEFMKEASKVSHTTGEAWDALRVTVAQTFPDAVVTPFLFIAATDSTSMTGRSNHVYRFSPVSIDQPDIKRIHGNDERVPVDALGTMVAFYTRLAHATLD